MTYSPFEGRVHTSLQLRSRNEHSCTHAILNIKLSYLTSFTVAELAAIYMAVKCISAHQTKSLKYFTNSKAVLHSLLPITRCCVHLQLVYSSLMLDQRTLEAGYHLCFQWIKSHCWIPGKEGATEPAKIKSSSTAASKEAALHLTPHHDHVDSQQAEMTTSLTKCRLWSCRIVVSESENLRTKWGINTEEVHSTLT